MNTSILGAAHLGEMIFIPCSYGIFYLTSIKKFVTSLEKESELLWKIFIPVFGLSHSQPSIECGLKTDKRVFENTS